MENKVKFEMSKEEKTQVNDAIKLLTNILEPKLITLSVNEKKSLPKMGDKTLAFVEKSVEYGGMYPSFIPDFIDVKESKSDLEAVSLLRQLFLPLERITNQLDDTITQAGSEAYTSALAIYKVFKNAASMGQAGASEASTELKARFPGKRISSTEDAE